MTDRRDRSFEQLQVGEALGPLRIAVTKDHIVGFQGFLGHSDIKDPDKAWLMGKNLHVDDEYSAQNMYGGVVGDGHHTIQYLCQLMTDSLPWGALVSGHSTLDVKLTNPTRPGDDVLVTGDIAQKSTEDGRDFVLCNVQAIKNGDTVVAVGTIKAYVPR